MRRGWTRRGRLAGIVLAVTVAAMVSTATAGATPLNITVTQTAHPGFFGSVVCAPGGAYCVLEGANSSESRFTVQPIVDGTLGTPLADAVGEPSACPTAGTCLLVSTGLEVLKNGRFGQVQPVKTAGGVRVELANIACASATTCYAVGDAVSGGPSDERIQAELVPIHDDRPGTPVPIGETGGRGYQGASVGWGTILPLIGCWDAEHCLVTGSYQTIGRTSSPLSNPATHYHNFSIPISNGHPGKPRTATTTEDGSYLGPVCAPDSSSCFVTDASDSAISVFSAGTVADVLHTAADHLDTPEDTLNTVACEDANTCFTVGRDKIVPVINGVLQAPQALPHVAGETGALQVDSISCPDSGGCFATAYDTKTGAGYLVTLGSPAAGTGQAPGRR